MVSERATVARDDTAKPIFVFLLLTVLVAILLERKILGRMQMRYGPNRVGPFGLLQSLADGVKLALKEGLVPAGVDRPIYLMAPVISKTSRTNGWRDASVTSPCRGLTFFKAASITLRPTLLMYSTPARSITILFLF